MLGVGFDSVIDVLKMKMIQFPANGGKAVVSDIPANEKIKQKNYIIF